MSLNISNTSIATQTTAYAPSSDPTNADLMRFAHGAGEHVLRPLIDAVSALTRGLWNVLRESYSFVDRQFTRLIPVFPGAEATTPDISKALTFPPEQMQKICETFEETLQILKNILKDLQENPSADYGPSSNHRLLITLSEDPFKSVKLHEIIGKNKKRNFHLTDLKDVNNICAKVINRKTNYSTFREERANELFEIIKKILTQHKKLLSKDHTIEVNKSQEVVGWKVLNREKKMTFSLNIVEQAPSEKDQKIHLSATNFMHTFRESSLNEEGENKFYSVTHPEVIKQKILDACLELKKDHLLLDEILQNLEDLSDLSPYAPFSKTKISIVYHPIHAHFEIMQTPLEGGDSKTLQANLTEQEISKLEKECVNEMQSLEEIKEFSSGTISDYLQVFHGPINQKIGQIGKKHFQMVANTQIYKIRKTPKVLLGWQVFQVAGKRGNFQEIKVFELEYGFYTPQPTRAQHTE